MKKKDKKAPPPKFVPAVTPARPSPLVGPAQMISPTGAGASPLPPPTVLPPSPMNYAEGGPVKDPSDPNWRPTDYDPETGTFHDGITGEPIQPGMPKPKGVSELPLLEPDWWKDTRPRPSVPQDPKLPSGEPDWWKDVKPKKRGEGEGMKALVNPEDVAQQEDFKKRIVAGDRAGVMDDVRAAGDSAILPPKIAAGAGRGDPVVTPGGSRGSGDETGLKAIVNALRGISTGAARAIPGIPAAKALVNSYRDNTDYDTAKAAVDATDAATRAANPAAYGAGNAYGTVAPLGAGTLGLLGRAARVPGMVAPAFAQGGPVLSYANGGPIMNALRRVRAANTDSLPEEQFIDPRGLAPAQRDVLAQSYRSTPADVADKDKEAKGYRKGGRVGPIQNAQTNAAPRVPIAPGPRVPGTVAGPFNFQGGGAVPMAGNPKVVDDISARVDDGEYVIKKSAARAVGQKALDAVNTSQMAQQKVKSALQGALANIQGRRK